MKIIHLSFVRIPDYSDPQLWLERLGFYTGILEAMATQLDTHSIHCINRNGVVTCNHVHYHFVPLTRLQQLFPLSFNSYVKQLEPDVLIIHGLHFSWQIFLLCLQLKTSVKIYVQHHAERPLTYHRYLLQRINDRFISGYFFASRELAFPWLKKRQIANSEKVIQLMEASSSFFPLKKANAQTFTQTNGSPVYLWVGRLEANKDPLTLVKAFANFAERTSDATLYMVFQQDDLLTKVRAVADAYANNIFLVGKVHHSDLIYWYNSADFIISTSHYEGSGIAVCEAMSCGCIPILSDIPSFRMMTKDGSHGLLFDTGEEKSLAAALAKSLTLDKEEMRTQVLRYFDQELSFKAIAQKIIHTVSLTSEKIEL